MSRRKLPLGKLAVLVLLSFGAFDLWAVWQWTHRRQEAAASEEQLRETQRIAKAIENLRKKPLEIEEGTRSSESLARLVEAVAQQAGLNPDQVVHVSPGAPRRLADSSYVEQATQVELREANLPQIVKFLLAVPQDSSGLQTPQLTLRVSPGAESVPNTQTQAAELWNVQMTLISHSYEQPNPTVK